MGNAAPLRSVLARSCRLGFAERQRARSGAEVWDRNAHWAFQVRNLAKPHVQPVGHFEYEVGTLPLAE